MKWVIDIQAKLQNKVNSIHVGNPLDYIKVDDLINDVSEQLIYKIDAIEEVVTGVYVKIKLTDYFKDQSEELYTTMLNTFSQVPEALEAILLADGHGKVEVTERLFTFNTHKRKITNFDLQFTVRATKPYESN